MKATTMSVVMDDVPGGGAEEAVDDGHPAGDCMRASLAAILEFPVEDVPHFVQYVTHPSGTDEWLWWWALVGFCAHNDVSVAYEDVPPSGWSLALGASVRGHQHVCVAWGGVVVHDPHPSRSGLVEVDGWIAVRMGDERDEVVRVEPTGNEPNTSGVDQREDSGSGKA